MPEPHFLDPTSSSFAEELARLSSADRWAVDTESDPFHRYFEKVCLIQISTAERDWFLDPLAFGLPDPIRALLSDASRTIVLHGADYDVRSLKSAFDLRFGKIVDTGVAAQLLGLPAIGLKSLLEAELSVVIDKKEQRSDWGKRPLTRAQLEYAGLDTRHLLALAARLEERLRDLGRLEWLVEECELLRNKEPTPRVFDPESWRKISGAKALAPNGQRSLRALLEWREARAQSEDVPPFRVIRNEVLFEIAKLAETKAPTPSEVARVKGVPSSVGPAALADQIERAIARAEPVDSKPVERKREDAPPPERSLRRERLRLGRAEWAAAHQLDPGVLLPSWLLERIAEIAPNGQAQLSEIQGLTAWRARLLGPAILAALAL